jgi:hypothetical protein
MQPCRFSLPAGWRLLATTPGAPAGGSARGALDSAAAAGGASRPVVACLGATEASADRRACLMVLSPVVPEGALLAQLAHGIEQDLAASAQAYGAQVVGRSAPKLTRLGDGPGGFQAVWLRYPRVGSVAGRAATPEAAAGPVGEGRIYLLIERRLGPSERRVPLLFIGGPDALPTHLAALEQVVSTLELSATAAEIPQPVHAAWSD